MRVILAEVRSRDAKLNDRKGRSPSAWASKEDQATFRKLVRESDTVIIGRNTYEVQKKAFRAARGTPRIVMTRSLSRFKKETVPGFLEFTSLSPSALIAQLRARFMRQVLLASGPKLTKAFLKAGLVDELWLTVEPIVLGGRSQKMPPYQHMRLLRKKRLNKSGTMLLKYTFQRKPL